MTRVLSLILFLSTLLSLVSSTCTSCETVEWVTLAGQHIEIGTTSFTFIDGKVRVQIQLKDGQDLGKVHIWASKEVPQINPGSYPNHFPAKGASPETFNPRITSFDETVPVDGFGDFKCGDEIYVAMHAEASNDETAWANGGIDIDPKGKRWGWKGKLKTCCVTPCGDSNLCTLDTCNEDGSCSYPPKVCTQINPNDPCTSTECITTDGSCVDVPKTSACPPPSVWIVKAAQHHEVLKIAAYVDNDAKNVVVVFEKIGTFMQTYHDIKELQVTLIHSEYSQTIPQGKAFFTFKLDSDAALRDHLNCADGLTGCNTAIAISFDDILRNDGTDFSCSHSVYIGFHATIRLADGTGCQDEVCSQDETAWPVYPEFPSASGWGTYVKTDFCCCYKASDWLKTSVQDSSKKRSTQVMALSELQTALASLLSVPPQHIDIIEVQTNKDGTQTVIFRITEKSASFFASEKITGATKEQLAGLGLTSVSLQQLSNDEKAHIQVLVADRNAHPSSAGTVFASLSLFLAMFLFQ